MNKILDDVYKKPELTTLTEWLWKINLRIYVVKVQYDTFKDKKENSDILLK